MAELASLALSQVICIFTFYQIWSVLVRRRLKGEVLMYPKWSVVTIHNLVFGLIATIHRIKHVKDGIYASEGIAPKAN